MDRRTLLATLVALPCAARAATIDSLGETIVAEEARIGGRIGFALLDSGTGRRFAYRAAERFPMCSTFKFLLAAAILARVDHGRERLDATIPIARGDIIANSPFSETRVGGTATIAELCAATVGLSDNAAANLLLPRIGGPAGLTRYARTLGDRVTRLDRTEPTLNEAAPGDLRDTTTPAAMLGNMQRLLLARTLTPASRAQLVAWMFASTTGTHRMRAGLPPTWRIADKTGAGEYGSDNELAMLHPPGRAPLLVASYLTGSDRVLAETNATHARIGTAIARAFA